MLLDTAGLMCFLDADDHRHEEAKRLFGAAQIRVTHSYVLAEFVTLSHIRGLSRADATSFVRALLSEARTRTIWVDEELHRQAMDLLDARPDKNYSLCDAVSFVLMRQYLLNDALTTDHHFAQEGFRHLLPAGAKR